MNVKDFKELYDQYIELSHDTISYGKFYTQWIRDKYETYLQENPDSEVSFKRFKKNRGVEPFDKEMNSNSDKKKLTFTLKYKSKDFIIIQRHIHIDDYSMISEDRIKKIALMIDEFVYPPEDVKKKLTIDAVISFEYNDEEVSYELPLTFKIGDKINLKPIWRDIAKVMLDKNEEGVE